MTTRVAWRKRVSMVVLSSSHLHISWTPVSQTHFGKCGALAGVGHTGGVRAVVPRRSRSSRSPRNGCLCETKNLPDRGVVERQVRHGVINTQVVTVAKPALRETPQLYRAILAACDRVHGSVREGD